MLRRLGCKLLGQLALVLILLPLFCTSCNKEKTSWHEYWTVASQCAQTPDNPEVWWVKRNGSTEWTLLYPPFVIGLNYEEGYEYDIVVLAKKQVVATLPEDSPSTMYYLEKITRKEKMESSGIPF